MMNEQTDRRNFLQKSLLGTTGLTGIGASITSTGSVTAETVSQAAEGEIQTDVDVLVAHPALEGSPNFSAGDVALGHPELALCGLQAGLGDPVGAQGIAEL